MKHQFVVTIEGDWVENGRPATAKDMERMLRRAVKEGFDYLAKAKIEKITEGRKKPAAV